MDPKTTAFVRRKLDESPIMKLLEAEAVGIDEGSVELSMLVRPALCQVKGLLQAGVVATLCDAAAGAALGTVVPAGTRLLSTDLSVKYLTPASGPRVVARCRVIHNGGSLAVAEVKVLSVGDKGAERLSAVAVVSVVVIPRRARDAAVHER